MMQRAGQLYLGTHDFRNFCKIDVVNVHNYEREIISFDVQPAALSSLPAPFYPQLAPSPTASTLATKTATATPMQTDSDTTSSNSNNNNSSNIINNRSDDEDDVYEMTIRGKAFLWHQIRCMAAVLFLIGARKEKPEVITVAMTVSVVQLSVCWFSLY